MKLLLLSGEGPTDIGCLRNGEFVRGPMACIVESLAGSDFTCQFIEKQQLTRHSRHPFRFRKGTYHYRSAVLLAEHAIASQNQTVAILFRDADNESWQDIAQSIDQGFRDAGFDHGVAMVPKPQSEAWLICALKPNPYQACARIEDRSGRHLKQELANYLSNGSTAEDQADAVRSGDVDPLRIDMPSFNRFRECLAEAIRRRSSRPA